MADNKEKTKDTEKVAKAKPDAAEKAEKAAKSKAQGKKGAASNSDIKIAADGETRVSPKKTPRLKVKYDKEVIPQLMKEFTFKNAMQVPRLKKVVINCAIKEAVGNPKVLVCTILTFQVKVFTASYTI